jgi:hypothetical protein
VLTSSSSWPTRLATDSGSTSTFRHERSSISFPLYIDATAWFCITAFGFIRLCIRHGIRAGGALHSQPQHVSKTSFDCSAARRSRFHFISSTPQGASKIAGIWACLFSKIISFQNSTCTIRTSELLLLSTA